MNRQLLFRTLATMVACLALALPARAYDFYMNGIYYSINGTNVTVQNNGSINTYSGDIVVPAEVTYEGQTYTITNIGYQSFKGCTGLTSIRLPETVQYIMNEAFMDCSALTSMTIPSSVATMYQNIFKGCTSLTDIYCLWQTPRSINANNFDATTYANATLHVPFGTKSSYKGIAPWSSFTHIEETSKFMVNGIYYNVTGTNTVEVTYRDTNFNYYSGSVSIPSSVTYAGKSYTVTAVGRFAFRQSSNLTSVTIPSTVTLIDYGAFHNCLGLTSFTMPNSVTTLGEFCFQECQDLTNITLSNALTNIPRQCFTYCTSLTSITIPASVKEIYYFAFFNCQSLQSVTIQEGVEQILNGAFGSCTSLESFTIPASVTTIIEGVLATCTSLASINVNSANTHYRSVNGVLFTAAMDSLLQYPPMKSGTAYSIPTNVKVIGTDAFSCCANLESVTLPNGLTTIGSLAFFDSEKITSFFIPASVSHIGERILDNCLSLVNIEVAADNQNYMSDYGVLYTSDGKILMQYPCSRPDKHYSILNTADSIGYYAFSNSHYLKSVYIPSGIKMIDQATFFSSNLERVVIDEGLERIERNAFGGCSYLKSVYLPSTLNYIGDLAFQVDTQLGQITFAGSTPPVIGYQAFYGTGYDYEEVVLYVPANAVSNYQSLDWNSSVFYMNVNPISSLVSGNTFTIDSLNFEVLDNNLNVKMTKVTSTNIEDPGISPKVSYLGNLCTVTMLADHAMAYCTKMKKAEIPFSVQTVDRYCAYGSTKLENLILREGVKRIDGFAFSHISKITSVDIPASVDSISGDAFSYDPALRSINVSGTNSKYCSVDGIVFSKDKKRLVAFANGHGLEYTVPNGTQIIGRGAFRGSSSLATVILPESLRKIDNYAFTDCSGFNGIDVPNGVTTIGNSAFLGCTAITRADLPATLTELGYEAFHNVTSLSQLNVRATTPPTCLTYLYPHSGEQSEPFIASQYSNVQLVVPIGCAQAYRAANIWKKFQNISETEFPVDILRGDVNSDGSVSIADVTALIDYLLGSGGSISTSAADVNLDNNVSIADVTMLIDYLLGGAWPEPDSIDMWYLIGDHVGSNPWENDGTSSIGRGLIPLYPVGEFDGNGKGELVYVGYFGANDAVMLIHHPGSRDDCWGMHANGIFAHGGEDIIGIPPGNDGYYNIILNTKTNKFYFYPYSLTTPVTFNTINIIGGHCGWDVSDPLFDMTSLNPGKENHNWIFKDFTVTGDNELKFTANHNWDYNWGEISFPYGRGLQNGGNVPVKKGTYDVFFNDITGDFNFIEK